jgi:hypothetical protein
LQLSKVKIKPKRPLTVMTEVAFSFLGGTK